MVTSGAAPLIVYGFRRVRCSTSTDTRRSYRRRREHIPTCAGGQRGSVLSFFPLHTNDLT
jgi:hypothetical protein